MDFDEIVVKDSPGLCRCCLSEGCYKDLSTEYTWMGDNEVYADMLLECFDISITQHSDGPNGPNRLICEVCITRLRDACNFKKQVLESEKKFVDMLGRGDFKPKAVIIYQAGTLKTEPDSEPLPGPSEEEVDAEYLDEDLDFGDDEFRPDETLESLEEEDITVSTLPVKGKRGRKSKAVKSEKKSKITKISTDEAKASKSKDDKQLTESLWESIAVKRRHNLQIIFNFTTLIPFNWSSKFTCFYCDKVFNENDYTALRKHTKFHGDCFPDNYAVRNVVETHKSVKVDISDITCELCNQTFVLLDDLVIHLDAQHNLDYVTAVGNDLDAYNLKSLNCLQCDIMFSTFTLLKCHIDELHPKNDIVCIICRQICKTKDALNSHNVNYHTGGGNECDLCPETFMSKEGLEYHRELLHDTVCEICEQVFPTAKLKRKHINTKHSTKLKCFACSRVFESKTSLKLHTKCCYLIKDADSKVKVMEDDEETSKDVVKSMRLNMHNILNMSTIIPFKWFMNRFRCFYCKLDFNDPEPLREHSVTEHPYCHIKCLNRCRGEQGEVKVDTSSLVCKQCSNVLDDIDQLVEHLINNHDMNYDTSAGTSFLEFKLNKNEMLCPFCNDKFSFFGNILKHINDKHFEKNFICTYCGLYFCKEVNLRGHISSQHNIGLQCPSCQAKLPNKSKLILHMANNHGAKVSKCSMCSLSFSSSYIRAKHMVEKHNLEFKCKQCKKIFPKNSFLQKHIKRLHANEDENEVEASTSTVDTKPVKKEPKLEEQAYEVDLLPVLNSVDAPDESRGEIAPYVRQHSGVTSRRKRNIQLVLNMSTVMPFKWCLSSFRCFYCSKNFNDPIDLKNHCTAHTYYDLKKSLKRYKGENVTVKVDVASLSCRICSVQLDDLNLLIDHLIVQHQAGFDKSLNNCFMPFRLIKDNMVCLVCAQSFTFFGHLLMHYNEQHQSKDHICSYCGLTFSKFVNLRAHISNRHRDNSHKCTECYSTFQTKSRLLTHMARFHGTKVSKCRECEESFTSPYLRSKHMVEKHNLEYKCLHCDKVFPKNSIMKTHIRRVHLRERNVQCDVCSEKFFDNVLLRLHMVKHEGVRNFKCDFCGKTFLWLKNLRAHVKRHSKDIVPQNDC